MCVVKYQSISYLDERTWSNEACYESLVGCLVHVKVHISKGKQRRKNTKILVPEKKSHLKVTGLKIETTLKATQFLVNFILSV